MNTNPKAKTILCYGDSNTWGRLPDRTGRYEAATRWTGQLQDKLGNNYYVIEEGLPGRTTNLDDPDSVKNGLTYLVPCLKSHDPIDHLIIMLGTNDFKYKFNRTVEDNANGVEQLIHTAKEYTQAKILLISPVHINPAAPRFMEFYKEHYSVDSGDASKALAPYLKKIALQYECQFIDAAEIVNTGIDGIHHDELSNTRLAEVICSVIRSEH